MSIGRSVTIRQLQIFVSAARTLSFSRTSEELHLTQPAVSMQVKQLEDNAGIPLFERVGKRLHLTQAGEELARHALHALEALKDAEDALAAIKGLRGGRVTIAVVSTAKYFAPKLLATFALQHPDVELRLSVNNREAVVQQLVANEVDLAIMGVPSRRVETVAIPFASHPLVIIAAPDHPLARRRKIPLSALQNETFLVREPGSGTRSAMERFFGDRRVQIRVGMEMDSNETIKQAVMAGMGISFLSMHTIGLELATGCLAVLRVEGLPVMRRWHVVHRQEKRLSPAADAFKTFMLEQGAAFLKLWPEGRARSARRARRMDKRYDRVLVWFRRDLRVHDHAALYHALKQGRSVHCVFVFDSEILEPLPRRDRRVEFIRASVLELQAALERLGGGLVVLHGRAREEVPRLAARLQAGAVYCNRDYEPAALERDAAVERALDGRGIALRTHKDQVIFEKDEVLTRDGRPFRVFTAYKNAWLERLQLFYVKPYPVEKYAQSLASPTGQGVPALAELGFEPTNLNQLQLPTGTSGGKGWLRDFLSRIDHYHERRDYPAVKGPSYLSVHLRFGTLSIRELAREAFMRSSEGARTWLSELIWRDFYCMILHHHPHVVSHAFHAELDHIPFPNREDSFQAWCEARTGYPLVDAAMRQINQTGYMHNRLRMVVASFLVKDLHVDWRWGERYFARHLNDYDLAANNGGWQWAASTGCDAQPYFRIFNPVTQSERFDPEGKFIRLYLPELAKVPARCIHAPWLMSSAEQKNAGLAIGRDYPAPIVDHAQARKVTLELYGRKDNGVAGTS